MGFLKRTHPHTHTFGKHGVVEHSHMREGRDMTEHSALPTVVAHPHAFWSSQEIDEESNDDARHAP